MKIIGVIPARYASSRLPGKPLADICGKPMIWWVYQQAIKVQGLNDVICAVDDDRVLSVCKQYNMNAIMTKPEHKKHIDRIHEVSERTDADYYTVVCGDEPLTDPSAVQQITTSAAAIDGEFVVISSMCDLTDPVEAYDSACMKCAVNENGLLVYISRSIIPLPYKTVDYTLKRLVGIELYNKRALNFFVSKPTGVLEAIEDITLLRYLEHFIPVHMIDIKSHQIGVDTTKNLDAVRKIIKSQIDKGAR